MPCQFAYSTNAYTRWPLERAIADVRHRGFDGVEILADLPHAFPPSAGRGEILRALDGFPVSNVNANTSLGLDPDGRDPSGFWPSLVDPDPPARQMKVDYVKQALDLARAIGAPCVCTATGRLPAGLGRPEAWAHLRTSLEEILAHAARGPEVRLGIEYEPGFLVDGRESAVALLRTVDHPLLGVNLDLGHAACEGEDLAQTIEAFAGRIWNIHIEDIRGRVHEHLVPGEGDIDFTRVRRALDRIGYDRFVTLELYPYKDDPGGAGTRGLAHLRPIFT